MDSVIAGWMVCYCEHYVEVNAQQVSVLLQVGLSVLEGASFGSYYNACGKFFAS